MFFIIDKLFPPLDTGKLQLSPLAEARTQLFIQKVNQVAQHLHVENIEFCRLDKVPFWKNIAGITKSEDKFELGYSYFLLIEPEDFPADLKPIHASDPRLNDDVYLSSVAKCIADKFGCPPFKLNWKEKAILRTLLRLCATPERLKAVKEFIINHELAHLHYHHSDAISKRNRRLSPIFTLASVGIQVVVSIKLMPRFLPRYPFCFIFTSLGIACLAAAFFNFTHIFYLTRKAELEADAKAVSLSGKEGGLYFFEAFALDPALKSSFISRLNPYRIIAPIFRSHPSDIIRIRHILSLPSV